MQHHLLERVLAATGKLSDWDRTAFNQLLTEFAAEVKSINQSPDKLPIAHFAEMWRAIQSEFTLDNELQALFAKPVPLVETVEQKPISINTKTTNMPIETIGGRSLVQFTIHGNPQALIDPEQVELEQRLHGIEGFEESVQAQEDGYYYENYGLLNKNTLEKLFSVTSEHPGIGGLTKEQTAKLFKLMEEEGWIRQAPGMEGKNKYQLTAHPSEFYSSAKCAGYLTEAGIDQSQIRSICDRLEIFLYQTAVNGGSYSLKKGLRMNYLNWLK